jgi:hypothetical protein
VETVRGCARFKLTAVLRELVQTTAGKWITRPPSRCPNGPALGPNQVLVGHQACLGDGGGHTRLGAVEVVMRWCTGRRSTPTALPSTVARPSLKTFFRTVT